MRRTARKPAARATAQKSAPRDIRTAVLMAALPDVAFDGWSDDLLERAAKKAKVSGAALDDAFPAGATDLVVYFSRWADDQTVAQLPAKKLAALRVRDRIALGVRTRLEILHPWRQALSAATAYMAMPHRSLALPQMVWRTADALWLAAGDTATDYNRYTKRFLLSGVLTATTLFWLNDDSDDYEDTWDFLDDRIENVMTLGKVIGKVKDTFRKTPAAHGKRA